MAFDKTALKESAKKHFVERVREKVNQIAGVSRGWTIEAQLKNLREIVLAGREFGVTVAEPFSDNEISELLADLRPLRELNMNDEARAILIAKLREKGTEENVLEGLPEPTA